MASTSISSDISHVFSGRSQVLPAPGGDLIRDGASVLPTGRRWPMKREFQEEDLDVLDYINGLTPWCRRPPFGGPWLSDVMRCYPTCFHICHVCP